MFLKAIAQKHMRESFDSYDAATKTFTPRAFEGRIDLTDRFLSIYNRPTRKRQLFTKPETVLPDSYVFRHRGTGDIYILGQVRQDARYDVDNGDPYVSISMLHLVTPEALGSSGLAVHTRRVIKGPPENPGWLVEEVLNENYLDIEFRTSSAEEGVYDSKVENFYAWTPITVLAAQWDFFTLSGIKYRVVDTFTDIGMRGLRLDREPDPRVDVVIFKKTRVYDRVTHTYVTTNEPFNVTAIVPENTDLAAWDDSNSTSIISLVIDFPNIGFVPQPNQEIEYQDRIRVVKSVVTQAGEKQYRINCE